MALVGACQLSLHKQSPLFDMRTSLKVNFLYLRKHNIFVTLVGEIIFRDLEILHKPLGKI